MNPEAGRHRAPSAATPQRLRINGYDLAYAEAGSGRPLMLVHGSLCDLRFWGPQLALGRNRRVLAPSLRRYWPEVWDGSGGGFSPQQHVDDLAALIETLGGGPVDLVGHSRGGMLAWMLAQQRPQLLRSLVLADPALAVDAPAAGSAIDLERGDFRRRALALIRDGDAETGLALFVDMVSGPDTWAQMVPALKQMMRDNANTLIGQVGEPREQVTAETAAELRLPLLLIGGERSPAPYPAILDALAALLPGAPRVTIAAASHAMNLWNARAFNTAVEGFLARL
jgi:pimeloyl-ACP methyl ester carboxylesterase